MVLSESLAVAALVAVAALPFVSAALRRSRRRVGLVVGAWLGLSVSVAWGLSLVRSPPPVAERDVTDRPIQRQVDGYVSSDTCRGCHPDQYSSWHDSYHRKMTQRPSPLTVEGRFEGVELGRDGRRYRLERKGDEYWIELDGKPGVDGVAPRIRRQVVLVTGSHRMQTYWYSPGEGRKLSLFEYCYHIVEQRWLPLDDIFLVPEDSRQGLEGGAWNQVCSKCHSTHRMTNPTSPIEMDTQVAEFGIACEACHGPAEAHVALNHNPLRRYRLHLTEFQDDTIVNPSKLDPRLGSQACGQCHAFQRTIEEGEYQPGRDLSSFKKPRQTGEQHFWSDGMVRISGREYNGLLESPCFVFGNQDKGMMSCMSCHEMHPDPEDQRPRTQWADDQLRPGMLTNTACTQCHQEYEAPDRLVAHTLHGDSSTGSSCYNCHMPHTTIGQLKHERSHQISSPDVRVDVTVGRTNACNLCHLDQTLAWTAGHLQERYGIARPELSDEQSTVAESVRMALRGDAGQRALMAWSMGWAPAAEISGSDWRVPYLLLLLTDSYPGVRWIAWHSLREIEPYGDLAFDYSAPVEDRAKLVRAAFERWAGAASPETTSSDALLMDGPGRLRNAAIDALLAVRDNRPVYLVE